jgi:hypothetical protein
MLEWAAADPILCRAHPEGLQRERPRCLGAAVEAGLHLVAAAARAGGSSSAAEPSAPWEGTPPQAMSRSAAPPLDARMLLLTSGPATKARSGSLPARPLVLCSACLPGARTYWHLSLDKTHMRLSSSCKNRLHTM